MSSRIPSSQGFTVIELLVTIGVVLVLSTLTFGVIAAARDVNELDRAATRLVFALEHGRLLAQSEGQAVYLAIADHGALPATAARRAWALLRDPDSPQRMGEWNLLPKGCYFARDEADLPESDLLGIAPLGMVREADSPAPAEGLLAGDLRLLLRITPEGRFEHSGGLVPSRLLLSRGEWFSDATGAWRFAPDKEDRVGAVRLRFRPMTGVVNQEIVVP